MNLRQEHSANAFISAMPAELRALYVSNSPREVHANTIMNFEQFIDLSFTWSDTPQGRSFWSKLGQFRTAEQLQNWRDLLPNTGREILDKMPAELRALFFAEVDHHNAENGRTINSAHEYENANNTLDLFKTERSYHSFLGGFFSYDDSLCGGSFWKAVREFGAEANRANIVALCEPMLREITTFNGHTAPKYQCIKLTEQHYAPNSYARREDTIKSGSGVILKADSVKVRDQYGDLLIAYKPLVEENDKYVFIADRDFYARVERAHNYGIGRDLNYKWIKVDPAFFGALKTPQNGDSILRFFPIDTSKPIEENDTEEHKYINCNFGGFYGFLHYRDRYLYKCAVSGKHYDRREDIADIYTYISADRTEEVLEISRNTQIHPHFEYKGQGFTPIEAVNQSGEYVKFFNIESAINCGLIFSTCPHCNSLESQYHDRARCARRNFKNERYSYHSKKPRNISSRSEFKIGVEIEKESYEGAGHSCHEIFDRFGWVKESDGSLDGTTGYELVSPTFGLFGNNLIKEAQAIESRFPLLINGDASNACGGHIHFSKANTSGRDTLEMYCGYLPLLYAIYKGRTKQHYCQGKEKEELKRSGEKYQAVRVLDNRIEFRIFPKVKNLSTLQWRIELLRYIAKHPTANPVQVVNDLCDKRTKLHAIFLQIFSEQTIYKRALDTLTMAQKYDRNFYNIDFSAERKAIENKAQKQSK